MADLGRFLPSAIESDWEILSMSDARLAATIFAASVPRLVMKFTDNSSDELWIADIKACAPGRDCQVFRDVVFVESTVLPLSLGSSTRTVGHAASKRSWPTGSSFSLVSCESKTKSVIWLWEG